MSQKRNHFQNPSSPQNNFVPQSEDPQFKNFLTEPRQIISEYNFPEKQKSKYSKINSLHDSFQNESYNDQNKDQINWKQNQHSFPQTTIFSQTARAPFSNFTLEAKDSLQKEVPIHFRSNNSTETISRVSVKLFFQSKHGKPVVIFRLTKNDDVQFIKILEMGEADFQKLRNEQQLRVDYQQFPKKFFELFFTDSF